MEQLTRADAGHRIFRKGDIKTTKARILKKTDPSYTEEARRKLESGTVVLKAVFAADGTVRNIRPVMSLRYGLTEQAIKAAKKIKFEPATICGKPVLQYVQIEYHFSNY
jgi:protein TonB